VSKSENFKVYGCDISDFLIGKAINKGINKEWLKVCDATNMDCYKDNSFDYSYSIGSLEHFTDKGILKFVDEVYRITEKFSYHMVPISRNGIDNGWITPNQSYYNNSEEWWMEKFKSKYKNVHSINSGWKDEISIGKWFICSKT
jgi:ubiquinone/menaquinone biosynthesis C-methylase UbiE